MEGPRRIEERPRPRNARVGGYPAPRLARFLRSDDHLGPVRLHLSVLPVLALLAACSGESAAAPIPNAAVAQPAAAADDADCNFATPLVPGVPGSPGNLIVSPRNPNGDSELAHLMRVFVDDLNDARAKLEAGQPVAKMYDRHRKMRCAWPTKPEERNERFDTLAKGYLGAVRAFDASPSQANYNAIISGCIACHSNACGGPLDFIDGMKWQ